MKIVDRLRLMKENYDYAKGQRFSYLYHSVFGEPLLSIIRFCLKLFGIESYYRFNSGNVALVVENKGLEEKEYDRQ